MRKSLKLDYDSFFELMHSWNHNPIMSRFFKRVEIDKIFNDDYDNIFERRCEIEEIIYYTVGGENSNNISQKEKQLGIILYQKLAKAYKRKGCSSPFSRTTIKCLGRIKKAVLEHDPK
jgi:hypothetical protein